MITLTAKDMDIATGGIPIILLNAKDAQKFDWHHMDRLIIRKGARKAIAVLDIAETSRAVKPGTIGLFEEALEALNAKHGDRISIQLAGKPKSVSAIKKKLDGLELTADDTLQIMDDIVNDRLTDIELTTYVTANYAHGMSLDETVDLTRSMVATGDTFTFKRKKGEPIVDLHSIGGVPGNRTTPIVVSIIAGAGLRCPKTASRAITSPAGTADTMEVFADVSVPLKKLKRIMGTVGAFITWGGAVNLAPADDKIIRIEHPLSIDAEGQMIASIMAKKASVGATHLVLEIPMCGACKVSGRDQARHLQHLFTQVAEKLGITIQCWLTDGSQPIGNGIGPVLEARDVLQVLQNHKDAPNDLREKSLEMAGKIFELVDLTPKDEGILLARRIMQSGIAYKKFIQIIRAQGGKIPSLAALKPAQHRFTVRAHRTGKIEHLDPAMVAKVARLAGAPKDKRAGIDIHKRKGDRIRKGEPVFTVYSTGHEKLEFAHEEWKKRNGLLIV